MTGSESRAQKEEAGPQAVTGEVPASVHAVLRSAGQPLDKSTRAYFEPRFGYDLSRVRIHSDRQSAESARNVDALAYTVGSHVVFGAGQFAPASHRGRELLAHELAHTIQQRSANAAPPSLAPGVVSEKTAEVAGRDVASGRPASTSLPACGVGLARAPIPLTAYTDGMLTEEISEVRDRLKQKTNSGRDRDVDRHMALKWEIERRARDAAVAEAIAVAAPAPEPRDESHETPPQFRPGGFGNERIYGNPKAKKAAEKTKEERAQQALKQEEEDRPGRLITARRYLTEHGVSRWDMANVLTTYLTVNDLRILEKNGLEAPGFWTRHYSDKVIEAIDKAMPPDWQTAELYEESRKAVRRNASDIRRTSDKIESIAAEGPHAIGGRVVGATAAWVAGKDVLWGGEVGAAFGGVGDTSLLVRGGLRGGALESPEIPADTRAPYADIRPMTEPSPIKPPVDLVRTPTPLEAEPAATLEAVGEEAAEPDKGSMGALAGDAAAAGVHAEPEPAGTVKATLRAKAPAIATHAEAEPAMPTQPAPKGKPSMPAHAGSEPEAPRPRGAARAPATAQDPVTARLTQTESDLAAERVRVSAVRSRLSPEAWDRIRAGATKRLYNLLERRYVLKLVKTFPGKTYVEQVQIVGVEREGTVVRTADIARSAGITDASGRIADFGEVGSGGVQLGDLKSPSAQRSSVQGGITSPDVEGVFRPASEIGRQHQVERAVVDDARANGGKILIRGTDPVSGQTVVRRVDPDALQVSRVVDYTSLPSN